ncbi:S24 family peptidase [Aquibium microcysteis]|uniref:S24 family peptidase n=1 Tax=Aquibium microcysteis TaxID=675281 RepID=UPI001BC29A27|nr:S24 family peptidase [Aquibium microcysteis]MBS4020239.1 S24 family peptidase [Dechloromonas sp.]
MSMQISYTEFAYVPRMDARADTAKKLKSLYKRADFTMDTFAKALGFGGASSLQHYTTPGKMKRAYLDRELVARIEKALVGRGDPAITPAEVWQLAGPEFKRASLVSSFDPDQEADGPGYTREHWRPTLPGALPEIDVRVGAGEGTIGNQVAISLGGESMAGHQVVAEWVLSEAFLRHEVRASPANTLVMEVVGDSMFPTYHPGDRVLVDLAQNILRSDTVYVVSDGMSEPQIKRLQRVPFSDPALVKIISDNQSLETFEVELSRLRIIGRVCGHIARK